MPDSVACAPLTREEGTMEPIVLFGIQFTLSLVAYLLIAFWYVVPRLSGLPRELALVPLLWVHAFRTVGGTILAPGAVGPGVPMEFRTMIGYGDLITALLALVALAALRTRLQGAIALVWVTVIIGMLDTLNAIVQSMRFNVFTYALGVNWVIVTIYVPALLVSSLLIFMRLLRRRSIRRFVRLPRHRDVVRCLGQNRNHGFDIGGIRREGPSKTAGFFPGFGLAGHG